jgi:hypothetical protein
VGDLTLQGMLYISELSQTPNSTQTRGDRLCEWLDRLTGLVPDLLQDTLVRPPLRPGLTNLPNLPWLLPILGVITSLATTCIHGPHTAVSTTPPPPPGHRIFHATKK